MQDMRDAIVVLLAGGQGERLWPLTRDRAKPAVPFGALYRIIDITLSNCVNSGLRRVFVLTQYKALSLSRHVRAGWSGLAGLGEYIEILPPQMRVSKEWYQGTADAVYQNIYSIGSERSKYVFILSGDHIYKMNYAKMLQQHIDFGADVTVGTIPIPTQEAARQFGVIEVEKCRARKMGLDFYVDLHVGVDGSISVHEGHEIAHQVKRAIQQSDSRIADVLVHIEPGR